MGVIIKNGIVYASPGDGSNIDDSTTSLISTWSSDKISKTVISMHQGVGEPGTTTPGNVGDFYIDSSTNMLYVLTQVITTPMTDLTDTTLTFKDSIYLPWISNGGSGFAIDGAYNITFTSNGEEYNQIYFYEYIGGSSQGKMYYRYVEGSTVVRSVEVCRATSSSGPFVLDAGYRVINITDGSNLTKSGSLPQDFPDFLWTPRNGDYGVVNVPNMLKIDPLVNGYDWQKISPIPEVTEADAGKFLKVNASGAWDKVEQPTEEWVFTTEDQYTTISKEVLLEE